MKIRSACLAVLLALCLCAGGSVAFAENDLWSEQYYRAADFTGELSDPEKEDLDERCVSFIETHHLDIVLLAVSSEQLGGTPASEFAQAQYAKYGFGYGETHDGFVWLYITDEKRTETFCFGAAEGRVPQDYLDMAEGSAAEFAEDHGVYGVLYIGLGYLSKYLEENPAGEDAPAPERGNAGPGMPVWYPNDPQSFVPYHDDAAPRVVDAADIFTDAEERQLETRIGEIRRELQKDLVVYTDVTDYGLTHKVCAADFYDFNGYGCGDEYEGACLFVCMDPDNRGWWCCCAGSESKGLYTEEIANLIDDALYEYMADGAYGEGVADWVENFRRLYAKGSPFAPEWYPDSEAEQTSFRDPDAPRVTDEIGLLTETERAELAARAAEISRRYDVDAAICVMRSPWGMDYDEVARAYYAHMGYGVGENRDGILLAVFKREGYYAASRITAFGSVAQKLTAVNHDRMSDSFKDGGNNGEYYRAASHWLGQAEHMLRTGRVARSTVYWILISLLGLLCGSIFGGVALGRAKRRMAPPRVQSNADSYFDPASRIRDAGRTFLYAATTRRYDPKERSQTRSSGGGSSHRSSYSGSYHGSSGRSHSGSGRRF